MDSMNTTQRELTIREKTQFEPGKKDSWHDVVQPGVPIESTKPEMVINQVPNLVEA